MGTPVNKELSHVQKWTAIFFISNFSMLYQIASISIKSYLNTDRLDMSYSLLIAILTAIVALVIERLVKNKALKWKATVAGLTVISMILFCLFVPKTSI